MTAAPEPTTPTKPLPHGGAPRGLEGTPSSSTTAGRFGRMFRHAPVYEHDAQTLIRLGESMVQGLEDGALDKPLSTPDDDENTSRLADGELALPAGLHVLRAVRRPRHHLRPGVEPHAAKRPRRAHELPHPALRPRLSLRTWA